MLTLSDEGYQRITRYIEKGRQMNLSFIGKERMELFEGIGRLMGILDLINIEMGLVLVSPEGEE